MQNAGWLLGPLLHKRLCKLSTPSPFSFFGWLQLSEVTLTILLWSQVINELYSGRIRIRRGLQFFNFLLFELFRLLLERIKLESLNEE